MLAYIEAKVRFKKQLENGKIKDVVEPYLVKADSFTEAEARVTKEVTPYISGEFSVAAVTKSNVSEIFYDPNGDRWYKVKANFIHIDEKTNTEKLAPTYYMVQAYDFRSALDNFMKGMKGTVADFEVASITETKVMDVFE
ncbi:DUF4494 domain-containing protein [bacterium J10(2018)]|jgi:hypothetical protein|nr:DUF4494 domain-containing protein [bacterium J10(2018)]